MYRFTILFLFIFVVAACSSDSSGSDDSSSDIDLTASISTVDSESTFSSPTSTSTTDSTLDVKTGSDKMDNISESNPHEEDPEAHFLKKKAILDAILEPESEADCAFRPNFNPGAPDAACYGPELFYQNPFWGDASDNVGPQGFPSYPSGDLGIWNATNANTSEACSAAKINNEVANVSSMVGSAIGLAASLRCYAAFNGYAQNPAEGELYDLTSIYSNKMSTIAPGLEVDAAGIERKSGSDPVFETTITFVVNQSGVPIDGKTIDIVLTHKPAEDDTFQGKVQIYFHGSDSSIDTFQTIRALAFSALYSKISDDEIHYRVRRAFYQDQEPTPFDSNGFIDFSSNWQANGLDAVLNLSLTDGTGSFQSAWQAGNMDGFTRVFLADLTDAGTGVSYFGFGTELDTSEASNEWPGRIQGMFCNWFGLPKISANLTDRVQKQELVLNDQGKWEAVTSNILFAPTGNCDYDGSLVGGSTSEGYGAALTFWSSAGVNTAGAFDNDNVANNPVNNNLLPVADIQMGLEPTRLQSSDFDL